MNELLFLPVAYARATVRSAQAAAPKPVTATTVTAVAATNTGAAAAGAETQTETTAVVEAKGTEETPGLKIDPAVVGFQALNFIILVVLLNFILYKPITALLKDREKRIKDGVENAEKADAMLKESNLVRQDMIKRASSESQELMEKARKAGEETKSGIIQDAHKEADHIIKSGHSLVEMEKTKTAQELKALAVNMVIAATEKVLREKLDASKDSKMIEESLNSYAA